MCFITGFATILFWGRFFLPIPYRIPIYGVMARPIQVVQSDNPAQEDIDRLHTEMMDAMTLLFETHKSSYGWGDKKLVIK
jgi:2-acylglycerol O-acyltransferase 2